MTSMAHGKMFQVSFFGEKEIGTMALGLAAIFDA